MASACVRILTLSGTISAESYEIDPDGTDRKGNVLLRGAKIVRAHPSRLLPVNGAGAAVYRDTSSLKAKCPQCDKPITIEIDQARTATTTCKSGILAAKYGSCVHHGEFETDWTGVEAGPLPLPDMTKPTKTKKPKPKTPSTKTPTQIDFARMMTIGELWTRKGAQFDYPDYILRSHVLLMTTEQARKYCFNSYNGTYGKKPNEEIESFIRNEPYNGTIVGYYLKGTLEQERKRLTKAGYVLESPTT